MVLKSRIQSGYTLLELLYVLSIVSILAAMLIPQLILQRDRVVEAQAQRRLRAIGSVMADYSLSHHGRDYADFQTLKDANLISNDLTQTSLIVDYSLAFITKEAASMGNPAAYTIIAYPRPGRSKGTLSTFAIAEDNVVRVFRPGPGVDPHEPHTWDPIS